jgi:hypothetical protein
VKGRARMSRWHWAELIQEGIYLSSLFIKEVLILSARDMADKERKQYGKK